MSLEINYSEGSLILCPFSKIVVSPPFMPRNSLTQGLSRIHSAKGEPLPPELALSSVTSVTFLPPLPWVSLVRTVFTAWAQGCPPGLKGKTSPLKLSHTLASGHREVEQILTRKLPSCPLYSAAKCCVSCWGIKGITSLKQALSPFAF